MDMKPIKKAIRKATPQSLVNTLHYPEAVWHARSQGHPAESMIMIGIVGSKGKTTTANMLWAVLSASGAKVGQIGTANIRIGDREQLNKYHMTMPGAPTLQKILAAMKRAGCKYVVMEVPSEGQTQWRHVGINFDMLVFTNVETELMAAHRNSMKILHKHNQRVFTAMSKAPRKVIAGQEVPKIIIANADAPDSKQYLAHKADKKATFSVKRPSDYKVENIKSTGTGVDFTINSISYHIHIMGAINALNAAGAIAAGGELGIKSSDMQKGLAGLKIVPGRMEIIDEGQDFTAIVDYAHTPASMQALMDSVRELKPSGAKIITLLGAEGGGRDVAKRPILGEIAAHSSNFVIICNVDPYDDAPRPIIEDIAKGAEGAGKVRGQNLFCIEDRRAGIRKALALASTGDIVLITGKGAEQSIVIGGVKSSWDDRKVVREELQKFSKK